VNGLKLILTAVLIAINAFFVIAEYALVRSRRARLELMREERQKGAALALEQLGNINEYISSVQIGVTLTSIGIGALGEPALASILKSAVLQHHLLRPAAGGRDGAEVLRHRAG
jgi:CBS domain containing-hemolysin-like protein